MVNIPLSLGGFVSLTNVGAAYDSIEAAFGLGSARVDFSGVDSINFDVGVNKIGAGTQSWQLWNVTDGSEIGVIDDAGATGRKVLSATFSNIPSGVKIVRVRVKSTVAADDPNYYGASLLLNRPTPSFERCGLLTQLIANVYGLTRDMRDNATSYKARIAAGQPVATVAAVMVGDADQYLLRIGWINTAVNNNQTTVVNALQDMGIALSQATALRDTLTGVANHTKAASLTTGAEISTEADYILANVPNYVRLW